MALSTWLEELRSDWLPHVTDAGLARLIELLESDSALLIHGAFNRAVPMGCLATHIAWHHPKTAGYTQEAGIMWLSRVAGLNPATSRVIRTWDDADPRDWQIRAALLAELCAERDRRGADSSTHPHANLPACEPLITQAMLQRVLEPEVMDTPEEARDYDAMDHSTVNRAFAANFLAVWNGRNPVLDVGTGTALIPIELCGQAPAAEVVAVDAAGHMLRLARENVRRAGLDTRIRVEQVNARRMPYPAASFPAVMSNSIIHHIPEPRDCLAEMLRVALPGATLFVRDLMRPNDEIELRRIVDAYAGDDNEHQRKMFADSLQAALTLEEIRSLVAQFGFDPAQVTQTSDRHWTWSVHGAAH